MCYLGHTSLGIHAIYLGHCRLVCNKLDNIQHYIVHAKLMHLSESFLILCQRYCLNNITPDCHMFIVKGIFIFKREYTVYFNPVLTNIHESVDVIWLTSFHEPYHAHCT